MTTATHQGYEERAAGLLTIGALALALVFANTPLRELYQLVHHTPLSVRVGGLSVDKPLILWINDGLMVFFFLLMGVELKREMLGGMLGSARELALPAMAALGGMVVPALIYLFITGTGGIAGHGWAVPTATDIVLALAALSLFGERVPPALRVFLMALAVFDDLGAIVIIALFYTERLAGEALLIAGIALAGLVFLNRFRVMRAMPYVLVGLVLWLAVLKSGVHATLAGVAIALAIPSLTRAGRREGSPLSRTYHDLRRWVAFGIVPVFAFFNAGIGIRGGFDGFVNIFLGVTLGLFLGKQLGVFVLAWLAIKLRLARLPASVGWGQLYGCALLAGIGFTMSLFISGLAFDAPSALTAARQGILLASLASALVGAALLAATLPTGRAAFAARTRSVEPDRREHETDRPVRERPG